VNGNSGKAVKQNQILKPILLSGSKKSPAFSDSN